MIRVFLCERRIYLPHFVKKVTTQIISILQDKQEGGSVLRTTNALRVKYPTPILVILEGGDVIILHIIENH
jgi:hypothetical protein